MALLCREPPLGPLPTAELHAPVRCCAEWLPESSPPREGAHFDAPEGGAVAPGLRWPKPKRRLRWPFQGRACGATERLAALAPPQSGGLRRGPRRLGPKKPKMPFCCSAGVANRDRDPHLSSLPQIPRIRGVYLEFNSLMCIQRGHLFCGDPGFFSFPANFSFRHPRRGLL